MRTTAQRIADRGSDVGRPTIRINLPPDKTPEQEAAIVRAVADSFEDSTGHRQVTIEVNKPEELDYHGVSERAQQSSRWAG